MGIGEYFLLSVAFTAAILFVWAIKGHSFEEDDLKYCQYSQEPDGMCPWAGDKCFEHAGCPHDKEAVK